MCVCGPPDSKVVVSASFDKTIRVTRIRDGKLMGRRDTLDILSSMCLSLAAFDLL